MENNNSLRMSKEERDSLRRFLSRAEGAEPGKGKISVVQNAESGLTVGDIQMDVSKNPTFAKEFFAAGDANGLAKKHGVTPTMLRQDHTALKAAGNIPAVEAFAKAVLATDEGKKALETAERKQIEHVANTTDRICGRSVPDAAALCGTPSGRRRVAAYVHQNKGQFDELEGFVAGKKVTIGRLYKGHPGREVQMTGPLTEEGFDTGYVAHTKWAQENEPAFRTRLDNIKKANEAVPVPAPVSPTPDSRGEVPAEQKIEQRGDADAPIPETQNAHAVEDEQIEEETPTQFAEAQPASAQAAAQSLAQPLPKGQQLPWDPPPPRPPFNFLDPTMKSPRHNLPSGLAKLLGIPHTAGGGGSDGQFASLAKQVGGDGLPSLISDLLGSGVARTNPKSAVKLFQTTINALNKPDDFDWNWSTSGKIDVDGDLGPQTRNGFGRALEKAGPGGFARKYALGQFRDYATKLDNGVERYESLERDGWIGPKTTDAFKKVLYVAGPKSIADDLDGLFGV